MCIVAKEVAKPSLLSARAYTHQPALDELKWGTELCVQHLRGAGGGQGECFSLGLCASAHTEPQHTSGDRLGKFGCR